MKITFTVRGAVNLTPHVFFAIFTPPAASARRCAIVTPAMDPTKPATPPPDAAEQDPVRYAEHRARFRDALKRTLEENADLIKALADRDSTN